MYFLCSDFSFFVMTDVLIGQEIQSNPPNNV